MCDDFLMRDFQKIVALSIIFLVSLTAVSESQASFARTESVILEEVDIRALLSTDASRLALGNDDRIDEQTYRIAAAYSHVAKGFWIAERCQFSEDTEVSRSFRDNIAVATQSMRGLLESAKGIEAPEADRLTQSIQMRSLQEMSAKKFFGCGPDAQAIYRYAVGEATYWAQSAEE